MFKKLTFAIIFFIFRCMNALELSWTPNISFLYFLFFCLHASLLFFKKGFVVEGRSPYTVNENEQGEERGGAGRGQVYLYVKPVKKGLIFQTTNRVLSDNLLGNF